MVAVLDQGMYGFLRTLMASVVLRRGASSHRPVFRLFKSMSRHLLMMACQIGCSFSGEGVTILACGFSPARTGWVLSQAGRSSVPSMHCPLHATRFQAAQTRTIRSTIG